MNGFLTVLLWCIYLRVFITITRRAMRSPRPGTPEWEAVQERNRTAPPLSLWYRPRGR